MLQYQDEGQGMCFICQEGIFNPICPSCLKKEIEYWLIDKAPELIPKIREELEELEKIIYVPEKKARCMLCGKEMTLCPYCYTETVYDLLKKYNPELIEEFIKFFNFDLERTGYLKEENL